MLVLWIGAACPARDCRGGEGLRLVSLSWLTGEALGFTRGDISLFGWPGGSVHTSGHLRGSGRPAVSIQRRRPLDGLVAVPFAGWVQGRDGSAAGCGSCDLAMRSRRGLTAAIRVPWESRLQGRSGYLVTTNGDRNPPAPLLAGLGSRTQAPCIQDGQGEDTLVW